MAGYGGGGVTVEWMAQPGGVLVGFNFMLAAMAIGGLFTVPGRAGFTVAIAGAALSAWLGAALSAMLDPLHLPVLTLPFLLSTYLWLGALGGRPAGHAPQLSLDEPGLPEVTHERARLALARGAVPGSVPVFPPFYGEWRVTQAFDGPHTHQPPWAHAIDFDVPYESIRETGGVVASADFPCFGTPLVSPVAGEVVGLRDNLPDVDPGDVDTVNNWGNYLMLRVPGMQHVLLAHLKQGSLTVRQGEWVTAGQAVAACGSSGRSPVPHLHLHVQSSGQLGAPTLPFHLANVLVREKGGHREFRLCHVPSEGHLVSPAPREERIAAAMRLSAGSTLQYRLDRSGERQPELRELRAELTLLGQSRLRSNGEASVAFEDTASVMGFYDRRGPVDPLLDMWVLALGLTPYSAAAERWGDRPALRLVPLDPARRLIVTMLRPLGGGCESAYSRRWDDGAHAWIQRGDHRLKVLPGIEWSARTAAWIEPGVGIRRLELEMFGRRHSAELVAA